LHRVLKRVGKGHRREKKRQGWAKRGTGVGAEDLVIKKQETGKMGKKVLSRRKKKKFKVSPAVSWLREQ